MRKGFTLIELLVVIAIIGLLSTLAVVAVNSARRKIRCENAGIPLNECETDFSGSEPKAVRKDESAFPQSDSDRCDGFKTSTNPPPFCLKLWGIVTK